MGIFPSTEQDYVEYIKSKASTADITNKQCFSAIIQYGNDNYISDELILIIGNQFQM